MIWVDGLSPNAFGLRQGAEADECDVLVQNQVGRYRFEIPAEPPFFLKARAKSGTGKIFGHVAQNASANKYAAFRTEREREIAGDGSEHRAKHIDDGATGRTGTLRLRSG